MNEQDDLITTALRDLAGQAAPPRLSADAVWRAGRRRRWAAITASAAGAAAAAVLVPLAVLSAPSHPAPGPPLTGSAGTHWPPPIQLQQVARVTGHRCPPRSHGLPGTSKDECFYLTHTGMTISRFAITITNPPAGTSDYELSFRLQRADVRRFADLTQKLANSPSPHDQMGVHRQRGGPIAPGRVRGTRLRCLPAPGGAHQGAGPGTPAHARTPPTAPQRFDPSPARAPGSLNFSDRTTPANLRHPALSHPRHADLTILKRPWPAARATGSPRDGVPEVSGLDHGKYTAALRVHSSPDPDAAGHAGLARVRGQASSRLSRRLQAAGYSGSAKARATFYGSVAVTDIITLRLVPDKGAVTQGRCDEERRVELLDRDDGPHRALRQGSPNQQLLPPTELELQSGRLTRAVRGTGTR
jgi:hypothetical protein